MRLMAEETKKAPGTPKSFLAKRYSSIAEVKRDLFPVAAAEEAAETNDQSGGYERLMHEFFGPEQHQPSR